VPYTEPKKFPCLQDTNREKKWYAPAVNTRGRRVGRKEL